MYCREEEKTQQISKIMLSFLLWDTVNPLKSIFNLFVGNVKRFCPAFSGLCLLEKQMLSKQQQLDYFERFV